MLSVRGWFARLGCAFLAAMTPLTLLALPCSADVFAIPPRVDEPGGYASTHILVRCDATTATSTDLLVRNAAWGATHCRPAFLGGFGNEQLAVALGMSDLFVVQVPRGTDTVAMAQEYAGLPGVHDAFVDGVGGVAAIPNDPSFFLQWGLRNVSVPFADIDATAAWDIETGESDPLVVAVVDSGVSPHSEFASRMVPGINTNDPDNPDLTIDECVLGAETIGHGTHVAGIIAASANNGAGIAGIHWGARIMPVRTLSGCGGTELQCANGIVWAVDHGADLINVSLEFYGIGNQQGVAMLEAAVEYAVKQGVPVIAAAGNGHQRVVSYPARFATTIAVSAISQSGALWNFSNYGPSVDISAPGVSIYSTLVQPQIGPLSGTSMAAPHVAGVAALLMSFRPNLTPTDVQNILQQSATDLGDVGWDERFGFGCVNAAAALDVLNVDIVGSDPPNGAIDARQPHAPDGTLPAAWQQVRLDFSGDAYRFGPADFEVEQTGGKLPAPTVAAVSSSGRDGLFVILDRGIEVGSWTTVRFKYTGTSVRIGFLPGDVNGDRVTSPRDLIALIDQLNAVVPPLPVFATDIDRSTQSTPMDILRHLDLLNGAGELDSFNGVRLPD